MVKMWDHFDDDRMGVVVRHIKRFSEQSVKMYDSTHTLCSTALPDYLFENDDRQPRGGVKRTKSGKVRNTHQES